MQNQEPHLSAHSTPGRWYIHRVPTQLNDRILDFYKVYHGTGISVEMSVLVNLCHFQVASFVLF